MASGSRWGRESNHVWTIEEDAKLIEALLQLKVKETFNGENGNGFKKRYLKEIEKVLQRKISRMWLKRKVTY